MSIPHVVVLGGGIAGLSAVWSLKQILHALPIRITLLEGSSRYGGWLSSHRTNDEYQFLFENGCRGIRPVGSGKEVMHLIESLGLQYATLASSPSARTRYIYYQNQLEKVPSSLREVFTSPLTRSFPFWLYRDLLNGKLPSSLLTDSVDPRYPDISIHDFINHRFGSHVSEILLDSVMSGVYAGDVKQLSALSTIQSIYKYGVENTRNGSIIESILKEQIKERLKINSLSSSSSSSSSVDTSNEPRNVTYSSPFIDTCSKASSISFVDGTETLAKELVYRLQQSPPISSSNSGNGVKHTIELRNRCRITGIEKRKDEKNGNEKIQIHYESTTSSTNNVSLTKQSHTLTADTVISALPANNLASILRTSLSSLGNDNGGSVSSVITNLENIPYTSVGIACMGWKQEPKPNHTRNSAKDSTHSSLLKYEGFGYLVPSKERGPLPPTSASLAAASSSSLPILGMVWDSNVFPGQIHDYADKKRNLRRYNDHCVTVDRSSDITKVSTPSSNGTTVPTSGYVLPTTSDHIPSSLKSKETRISVMIGGATWPGIANTDKHVIEELSLRAVREQVRITARDPDVVRVSVATNAIPQYTVGHQQRINDIESHLTNVFNAKFIVVGNSYKGVGVADTVSNGLAVGRKVAKQLYPELK